MANTFFPPSSAVLTGRRRTESILVVDDDTLVRNVCTAVLTSAGYRIFSAEGGDLALQMIKAMPRPVQLALIDVRMPRMSGPDLIRELLDTMPGQHIRFVLMSGYSDVDFGELEGRKDLRFSFLRKPFTAAALLETVRRELDASHFEPHTVGPETHAV